MKTVRLRTLLAIALLATSWTAPVGSAAASVDLGDTPAQPVVTVLEDDGETGQTVRVDFPDYAVTDVLQDDTLFDLIDVGYGSLWGEEGRPGIPEFKFKLEIPWGVTAQARILESAEQTSSDILLYPVQPPAADEEFFPEPPFTWDQEFYESDVSYPSSPIINAVQGHFRDKKELKLGIAAFRYNPGRRELAATTSIVVRIDYQWGPILGAPPRSPEAADADAEAGCDLLIITDPALATAADTLATRRNAQGISTLVRTTTVAGTTANAIKAYVQTAYDTWTKRPSYLLLLGDADLIPPFYRTPHPDHAQTLIGTDLYYSILNGPEVAPPYFSEYWSPDLALGRIPVSTLQEANAVIGKIADYEDNQWASGADALVSGEFQDRPPNGPDGFEDRRFIRTAEEVRDYLVSEGFDVQRLYATDSNVTPTNYNSGVYGTGGALPADLLRPTYPWSATTADITASINDGKFLVMHRDHGASANPGSWTTEGWGTPEFEANDVASLTNEHQLPVFFSINCMTGWFDGETDAYPTRDAECLCEAMVEDGNAGAVAAFGATRISYSGYNDQMARGFADAIWPNFDGGAGGSTSILRLGDVLNYGKDYMDDHWSLWPQYRIVEYEIFHVYGDPSMSLKIPSLNEPPTVGVNATEQSVQYSDLSSEIKLTATDTDGPTVAVTASGLPANIAETGVSSSTGPAGELIAEYRYQGKLDVPKGDYTATFTASDGQAQATVDHTVHVTPEDASVAFSQLNPPVVPVASAGGTSGDVYLRVNVAEVESDPTMLGDITKAVVSARLVPVAPGAEIPPASVTGPDALGDVVLKFTNVPVNTYVLAVSIGGNYYVGSGEDVFTVFDRSSGFPTGGGWFYWPGTSDRTSFGFVANYRKSTGFRGNLVAIRHKEDGSYARLKGNTITALAVGKATDVAGTYGWTTFSGKGVYFESDWLEGVGNYTFTVYAEDRGEPGRGADRFWLRASRAGVPTNELQMTGPAGANAVMIEGGNVAIPHNAR